MKPWPLGAFPSKTDRFLDSVNRSVSEGKVRREHLVLTVLDGTWATLIVRELLTGPKRFTELRAGLPGISPKTLSSRLRRFVRAGLVTRTSYPEIPPRVEYRLTPAGERLKVVLDTMAAWPNRTCPARPYWTGDDGAYDDWS